jgi:hypothetical protein
VTQFNISEGSFDPDAAFEDDRSFGDLTAGLAPPAPTAPEAPPPIGFDEITNKVFVNGFEFDADDHDSALRSKEAFLNPVVPMPQNYRPMGAEEFGGYIQRIKDPSIGRIIRKNFGIGFDNLQLLGGRGLQFLGAEETGQKIVDQQIEDLAFTQPYQRLFTDIDSAGGAIEWFIANLAQQGPNLIESALAAVAGGVVGALAGGGPNPFTAIGGAFLALSGKAAVKKAVIEAAKKHAAGKALDEAEKKLLREVASGAVARELKLNAKKISPTILRREGVIKDFLGEAGLVRGGAEALKRGKLQSTIGGAIVGRFVNSQGIGVSDIYGEQIESGTENRGAAFSLAIPYALADSIPELLGLGFFIKGGKSLATGVSKAGRGARALKRTGRAAAGGVIAAFGEGTAEGFQEALLLSQNPEVDAGSAEGINRLINSFAAGAGVGGALGVVGGAVRGRRALEGDNADILNPTKAVPTAHLPDQQELFPDAELGTAPILRDGQVQGDAFNVRGDENLGLDPATAGEQRVAEEERLDSQGRFGASLDRAFRAEELAPGQVLRSGERLFAGPEGVLRPPEEVARLRREADAIAERGAPQTILDPRQRELFPGAIQGELDLTGAAPAAPATLAAPVGPAQTAGWGARLQQLFPGAKLSDSEGLRLTPEQRTALFRLGQLEARKPAPVDPGATDEETQNYLANQLPAPSATPLAEGLEPLRQRFERDELFDARLGLGVAGSVTGELPFAQETSIDFPADISPLQGARTHPLRPTVNGEEAIFVGDRAVPVRRLLEKSEKRIEVLKELHTCLTTP